jgi:hypothetical protein
MPASKRNEALLAVGEAVILERKCHSVKNARRVEEVKAMGFDVRCTFRFRPSELHA